MAENMILSQLQDLLKNVKLNDLIKQAESALGDQGKEPKKEAAEEKNGSILGNVVKGLAVGGGAVGLVKVLKMLKSLQGGKIFGNLGKVAGLASLEGAAEKLQNVPENTEELENQLDELDTMVAVAIEDGVITPEEEEMLSKKAEELGINVEEFLAEVRQKCPAVVE